MFLAGALLALRQSCKSANHAERHTLGARVRWLQPAWADG